MHMLDKKLLRDFRRLWAQALAIALVLGCGVCVFVATFGMQRSLESTLLTYYERARFADVFASARRAPEGLKSAIAAIPGVREADTRIKGRAILDIKGLREPAMGRIVALPADGGPPALNVPVIRSGRLPHPDAADEVAVNAAFAEANGFRPGDSFSANLDGRKRSLIITGTVLSPEFIYALPPGGTVPDNRRFGVLWMPHEATAAAFDLRGAFNDVAVRVGRSTVTEDVLAELDRLLAPYGGTGAHDRTLQISHSFIDAELEQLRATSRILPPIFFVVSAFLVNMVLGRLITLERGEIGLFKAVGYGNSEIALHYLKLASLIAAAGTLIGWAVGGWLARQLTVLYSEFYEFPYLVYQRRLDTYALSGILGLASATLGSARGVWSAVRLAPAVAMSPPAPPVFRTNLVDRIGVALHASQPTMMILRGITRWPVRAVMSMTGLAAAVAILVASSFFGDALDRIIEMAFYQTNRQHMTLILTDDQPISVLDDVAALPGILRVEGQQSLPATLRHGHLAKRVSVDARPAGSELSRIVDNDGGVVLPSGDGIVLSERLANRLDAAVGDVIQLEAMTGRRETYPVRVTGTTRQFMGLGAYMDHAALNRMLRQAPQISAANVTLDARYRDALYTALKDVPRLAGLVILTDMVQSLRDTISRNVLIMTTIYTILAVLIAVGVTYNGARIQLSERARELASLRILGFTRAEVSYILVGELMLLTLLAQPLGWGLGAFLARLMTQGFDSDLYTVPLVLERDTFALSSLIVLATSAASALVVRRRIDRLDIVAVMKTRE